MQKSSLKNKIIAIIGPTGAGKTQVGFLLSDFFPCEFISADSMQIYRGMDIVTDKPVLSIRKKYPYHLLDIVASDEEYNVSDFCKAGRIAIKDILARKKTPVVVGGTGLYINSLLYGIFEKETKSDVARKVLEAQVHEKGLIFCYERLKKIDPAAALKINQNDSHRIIRALEVYEVTKIPISVLQKQKSGLMDDYQVKIFGLRRKRDDLYQRINQRVDFMVNAGLLDEVRQLLKKPLSKTAYLCIGIREMEGFLKGDYDFNEAVRLIKRNSRHFAKRQMTWFNRNKDIEWVDIAADKDLSEAAKIIYDRVVSLDTHCPE